MTGKFQTYVQPSTVNHVYYAEPRITLITRSSVPLHAIVVILNRQQTAKDLVTP